VRPTATLKLAGCMVGASTAAIPYVAGYGTVLFQIVAFGGWRIAAAMTSDPNVGTHPVVLLLSTLLLNLIVFLTPAMGFWIVARKRWSTWCSVTIFAWCVFYLLLLFWLFPAMDGL
jgi:hypothetical protein